MKDPVPSSLMLSSQILPPASPQKHQGVPDDNKPSSLSDADIHMAQPLCCSLHAQMGSDADYNLVLSSPSSDMSSALSAYTSSSNVAARRRSVGYRFVRLRMKSVALTFDKDKQQQCMQFVKKDTFLMGR